MIRVLVSRCLNNEPVRYNHSAVAFHHPIGQEWLDQNRIVFLCPELAVGFPTPRPPVEITRPARSFGGR